MQNPPPPFAAPPRLDPSPPRRFHWSVPVALILSAVALSASALVTSLMVYSHVHPPLPTAERTMGGGFSGGLCLMLVVIPVAALGAIFGIIGVGCSPSKGRPLLAVALNVLAAAVPMIYAANFQTW